MASIKSLSAVMPVLQADQISEKIIPTLVKAAGDPIPNVKFCLSKMIVERKAMFDPSAYQSKIVPKLKDMS